MPALTWKRKSEGGTPVNYFIYGPTGTGKTFKAEGLLNNNYYDKLLNKWWEDYEGEENVLVDDIGPDCIGAQHIKRWLDKKQFRAEAKFGSVFIRPKIIIFTSNYHPSEIWPKTQDYEAIMDRCQVIHLEKMEARDNSVPKKKKPTLKRDTAKAITHFDRQSICLKCYMSPCMCDIIGSDTEENSGNLGDENHDEIVID